ncbi:MAG: 4-hydroxyphenylpyruvate dioxygenase [Betaproteobacteria bacterium]|nr:4-hydroxyphenylpyruvate dioxygenase [Betaproteobacteria bacterium]MDE2046803.1 4-hydroxyphenylpyruvate dioxygenase [Betaproteobacteria bacterium]
MTVQEPLPAPSNPLGIDGIEFVEYATSQPNALGALLELMGFALVARHRSREVLLYRQGDMNVIVNADAVNAGAGPAPATPYLSGVALRVRDASYAYKHTIDLGAWPIPTRAAAMELNIPGIHGVGDSVLYFVDRYQDFSIYNVDFKPYSASMTQPPAVAGLHFFGIVQAIGADRNAEWLDFYAHLLGFRALPDSAFPGILRKGLLLESPCGKFYLQLIEPPEGAEEIQWDEQLLRIGLGTSDVLAAARVLRDRGVVFVDRSPLQVSERGALTQSYLGGVMFELVRSQLRVAS